MASVEKYVAECSKLLYIAKCIDIVYFCMYLNNIIKNKYLRMKYELYCIYF